MVITEAQMVMHGDIVQVRETGKIGKVKQISIDKEGKKKFLFGVKLNYNDYITTYEHRNLDVLVWRNGNEV